MGLFELKDPLLGVFIIGKDRPELQASKCQAGPTRSIVLAVQESNG